MMTGNDEISLRESVRSDGGDHDRFSTEHDNDEANLNEENPRRAVDSKWTRFSVLVGSSILQLPIWGRFSPSTSRTAAAPSSRDQASP